ncbi:unnamed protein product [Cylindrotheca closterium]|uniref:Uncharacterized protein n=1 Tax=Cylindrotheca closterium TaxID=2856 RepID=A0AAD2FQW5_9STRA|nr:unnamed protein product [Cylindrotheca closterium]
MSFSGKGGQSSHNHHDDTTPTTWALLATSVISATSAILLSAYFSHDSANANAKDKALENDKREEQLVPNASQPERIRSVLDNIMKVTGGRYLKNPLAKDLPLWLGVGYLIFNQNRNMASPNSNKLLDFLVVGLLLTLRRDEDSSSSDNSSKFESKRFKNDDDTDKNSLSLQSRSIFTPIAEHDLPLPLPHSNTDASVEEQDTNHQTTNIDKVSPTTPLTTNLTEKDSSTTRYMELMVYNVSHTDMVFSLDTPANTTGTSSNADHSSQPSSPETPLEDDSFCLCRPRFSTFDYFSKKVAEVLQSLGTESLVKFPRYERCDETNRYTIKSEPMLGQLPIGFSLPTPSSSSSDNNNDSNKSLHVTCNELNDLRLRGRDSSRIANIQDSDSISLNAVFFPLLGTLMPQWQGMIQQKYSAGQKQPKQVLFLVSGVGSPRNWTHSMTGNSTQMCAKLMQHYLQTLYPHLIVVRVHSETNIFRYDENISFVQNELMPCIQAYRDAHAKGLPYPDEVMNTKSPTKVSLALMNSGRMMENLPFMNDWKKSFHVTLSFGDGSPARNHAIQAALRTYRPTYYHCWQLKTFWHESKIVDSDIEIHSFEEMETVPALSTKQLQDKPLVMQVVDEIKTFSMEMTRIMSFDNHDIQKFWLRKTHKPVLAVLAVQMPDGRIKLYRGTNMEVSMPTGSLCAERNVIGTALADNPSLKRQDLKAIAVLSVPKPSKHQFGRLVRSGSVASYCSMPSLAPDFDNGESPKLMPSYSTETLVVEQQGSPVFQDLTNDRRPRAFSNASASPSLMAVSRTPPLHPNSITNTAAEPGTAPVPPSITLGPAAAAAAAVMQPKSPIRRVSVYHGLENNNKRIKQKTTRSRKRHLFVHSNDDMNPLRPCGACNEWLKKIAESNPYFQILTFTDADCNGVYCGFCDE